MAALVQRFRERVLNVRESLALAEQPLLLRYSSVAEAPVSPERLLLARRPEDEGTDLWNSVNRVQQNLIQGGVSDDRRDRRGRLRTVQTLRGIDFKVTVNKRLWGLAERLANSFAPAVTDSPALVV